MRPPVLILLAGLAVSAAACATGEPAATPPGPDSVPEGLAYGVAESDDLRLGLDCARASGRLLLTALGGSNGTPEIHVESGGETERFPAQSEPSQLHDGDILTAEAAADAPVFQRFRRVGWIALWRDGEREAFAPHPGSRPNVERFFAFCG